MDVREKLVDLKPCPFCGGIPFERLIELLKNEENKMREILFRGKRMDNGEWIFGDLIHEPWAYFIQVDTGSGNERIRKRYAITEETFGQYTGLKDKNGKRIFEGDIVRYTFDSPDDPTATENGLKVHTGRIFWSDWRASFAVTAGRNGSASLNNDVARYVRGRQIYEYVRGANTVEVIGNIHDNPEMLKGGED